MFSPKNVSHPVFTYVEYDGYRHDDGSLAPPAAPMPVGGIHAPDATDASASATEEQEVPEHQRADDEDVSHYFGHFRSAHTHTPGSFRLLTADCFPWPLSFGAVLVGEARGCHRVRIRIRIRVPYLCAV